MSVKFADWTPAESLCVGRILLRAVRLGLLDGDLMPELRGDLCAVDGAVGLDLAGLENSTDEDFRHDILGIRHNLDRRSGELGGAFEPRNIKK